MATEYRKIKLIDKASDPCTLSDAAGHSQQFVSHEKNGKHVRSIVRDGNVVAISCVKSGRSIELPWSSVLFATPAEKQPQATSGQSTSKRG